MLLDRVSNPGPLTYESGALPIALRGPATKQVNKNKLDARLPPPTPTTPEYRFYYVFKGMQFQFI